jgi:hypothetical protein
MTSPSTSSSSSSSSSSSLNSPSSTPTSAYAAQSPKTAGKSPRVDAEQKPIVMPKPFVI